MGDDRGGTDHNDIGTTRSTQHFGTGKRNNNDELLAVHNEHAKVDARFDKYLRVFEPCSFAVGSPAMAKSLLRAAIHEIRVDNHNAIQFIFHVPLAGYTLAGNA
ncbi:MAG: hypothetical protein ACYDHP_02770 [Ferrimicrobium sp.]